MTNSTKTATPKSIIKTLTFLHIAYCAAIFVFGNVIVFITENAELNLNESEDIFFFLVPAFAIAGSVLGQFIYQKNLTSVQQKSTLQEKLIPYQSARIIRYAMIEGPAFLGIVIFMITSNLFYLIIAAILLAYLVTLRPTTEIIKEELNLTPEQEREFQRDLK